MVESSNLHIYLDDLRLYIGDIEGTEYSTPVLLTSLVNAVRYLSTRWNNRYLIYSSGIINSTMPGFINVNTPDGVCTVEDTIQENDIFRNCHYAFSAPNPPIVEQQDLPALLIAASYLLRRSTLTSSMTGFSWSTPDLSYSNIEGAKTLKDLVKQDLDALEFFFKFRLGRIQVGRLKRVLEPVFNNPVENAAWFTRMAAQTKFNER